MRLIVKKTVHYYFIPKYCTGVNDALAKNLIPRICFRALVTWCSWCWLFSGNQLQIGADGIVLVDGEVLTLADDGNRQVLEFKTTNCNLMNKRSL